MRSKRRQRSLVKARKASPKLLRREQRPGHPPIARLIWRNRDDNASSVSSLRDTACTSVAAMIYATHIPSPPLDQFIEMLWFHEGFDADHRLERVLPDGSMEIIINLHDEKRHIFDPISYQPREIYRRSWLSGPHSEFILIDTAPNASIIGVHLRPGGASAFFGLPLAELRNSVVELDTLWNCEAQNLRDQLLEAPAERPSSAFSRMRFLSAGADLLRVIAPCVTHSNLSSARRKVPRSAK